MTKSKKQVQERFSPSRERLHELIFEADTPLGKLFDIILMIMIIASIIVVSLETVDGYARQYGDVFTILEWIFTIFFTIEYVLRLYAVYKPIKYATSFFGVIDLLAILPSYISIFIAGTHSLMIIRALRLLRVFRIFKLGSFLTQGETIVKALKMSRAKIGIFMFFILLSVSILGAVMYLVEGEANSGFDNIPLSIYWAVVTLTTVGYGDIAPVTALGRFISAALMILGYSVIAVPTGIITGDMMKASNEDAENENNELHSHDRTNTQACRYCSYEGHDDDAKHCKYCGEVLNAVAEIDDMAAS